MAQLVPPKDGAVVRMYRIGHGDCFLLAFPGKSAARAKAKPVYVLIDCGYKPGSPGRIVPKTTPDEIIADLKEATGGHIDVAVITHEHQDHVNAITKTRFKDVSIGECWFAWTEDPEDDLANRLRKKYHDRLSALVACYNKLSAAGDSDVRNRLNDLISFELGGEDEAFDPDAAFRAAGAGGGGSKNKQSMKLFKDLQRKGIRYLRPHGRIIPLPGAPGVRVFVLGPPRDEEALTDLDPQDGETFGDHAMARALNNSFFAAALDDTSSAAASKPFASRYCIPLDVARATPTGDAFLAAHYGNDSGDVGDAHVADNAAFRRIDHDWLQSAGELALDMSNDTNNSSLVLAFELEKSKKVLLFVGDAQRGNWISWADGTWRDGDAKVTARDLLARTVLYKVGHHCSHNATLNGTPSDEHPNLSWMAHGACAKEFTAMITAVRAWAETQKGWDHPKKEIKEALVKKASGRVFQTDTDFAKMKANKPDNVSAQAWNAFAKRTNATRLFFDYTIEP